MEVGDLAGPQFASLVEITVKVIVILLQLATIVFSFSSPLISLQISHLRSSVATQSSLVKTPQLISVLSLSTP